MRSSLGGILKRAFKTNEVMTTLLDSEAQSGPFDGGCLITARAIIQAIGRGSLVRLVDCDGDTQHYGAMIDGTIYDGDGAHRTLKAWAKWFAKAESITFPLIAAEGYDHNAVVPDDGHAVKQLGNLLREAADAN